MESNPITSVPSVKSVGISALAMSVLPSPERMTMVSLPLPDEIVSLPVPPSKVLPSLPLHNVSSPAPP